MSISASLVTCHNRGGWRGYNESGPEKRQLETNKLSTEIPCHALTLLIGMVLALESGELKAGKSMLRAFPGKRGGGGVRNAQILRSHPHALNDIFWVLHPFAFNFY